MGSYLRREAATTLILSRKDLGLSWADPCLNGSSLPVLSVEEGVNIDVALELGPLERTCAYNCGNNGH